MNRKRPNLHLNLNLAWTLFLATLLYSGVAAATDALSDPAPATCACVALGHLPAVPADGQPTL